MNKPPHLLRCVPLLVWCFGIGVLSLMASPPKSPAGFLSWDKFQHAAAYAVFTLLAGYACLPHFQRRVAWSIAFFSALLYGGMMEIAQGTLTAVRAPEWGDLAADALGAAIVFVFAFLVHRLRPAVVDDSPRSF